MDSSDSSEGLALGTLITLLTGALGYLLKLNHHRNAAHAVIALVYPPLTWKRHLHKPLELFNKSRFITTVNRLWY